MLWVARDRTGVELHHDKPEWHEENDAWNGKTYCCALPRDLFPELPIGECRELRTVEPVDEAKERKRFEADWQRQFQFSDEEVFSRDNDGFYFDTATEHAWMGWLAAKRDERGDA